MLSKPLEGLWALDLEVKVTRSSSRSRTKNALNAIQSHLRPILAIFQMKAIFQLYAMSLNCRGWEERCYFAAIQMKRFNKKITTQTCLLRWRCLCQVCSTLFHTSLVWHMTWLYRTKLRPLKTHTWQHYSNESQVHHQYFNTVLFIATISIAGVEVGNGSDHWPICIWALLSYGPIVTDHWFGVVGTTWNDQVSGQLFDTLNRD